MRAEWSRHGSRRRRRPRRLSSVDSAARGQRATPRPTHEYRSEHAPSPNPGTRSSSWRPSTKVWRRTDVLRQRNGELGLEPKRAAVGDGPGSITRGAAVGPEAQTRRLAAGSGPVRTSEWAPSGGRSDQRPVEVVNALALYAGAWSL